MEYFGKFESMNSIRSNNVENKLEQVLSNKQPESVTSGKSHVGPLSEESLNNGFRTESALFDIDKINSVINSEAILLITDKAGFIIYVNDNCCKNVDYRPDELIGNHTRIFKTGLHTNEFYQQLWQTLLAGEAWKGEITAKRKDGSTVWNFLTVYPILDQSNQPYQFVTLRTDITKQKTVENQVALIDKKLNAIIDHTNDVIGSIDANGKITFLNSGFEKQLGYTIEESIGKNIFDYIANEHLQKTKNTLHALVRSPGKSIRTEIKVINKRGNFIWFDFFATNYLKNPLLNGIIFISRDITRSKRITEEMKRMAYFDYLTGLPNRRYLENQLRKEILRARGNKTSLSLMLIDIDEFKYVNNSFGHSIGDKLLEDFASRLKNAYSDEVILCRLGGDEFIFLIPNVFSLEEINKQANRLIAFINDEPFNVMGNDFFITISVGVSVYPYSGENIDLLLKHADMAMYRAKSSGKNQYQIFSPSMNLYTYKQFTLRNDSKKALINNELNVYYQPRFDPMTNEITGAEALIRWNHPRWGMVSPDEFISMAEESGLIVSIGAWMLKKVCQQLKDWQMKGISIKKVSINLSSLELAQSNFIERVSSVLTETGLNPKWIEFEITERMIIEKEEQALKTLKRIKDLGITLALDDFGTGYSAINYLWKFPCDIIKIDKSLIKEIHSKNASYEVVATIIALCKKLNKKVVAEGVESKEQLELLKPMVCDEIQGYLFSRPVEEQKFVQFLKQGKWVPQSKLVQSFENKRSYFRIPLKFPLDADMTIERIGSNMLNIGSTKVLVEDIGPGGLRFISTINLPKKEDIILRFTTEMNFGTFQINGHIVWSSELEDDVYQYGVKFNIDENHRESLIKILHTLQVKLKDENFSVSGRFISENKTAYIKKQLKGNFPQTNS